jgi:hypothetical protein
MGWECDSGIHYYMLLRAGGRLICFCVRFHVVGGPAEAASAFDAENCPKIAWREIAKSRSSRQGATARDGDTPCRCPSCQGVGRPMRLSTTVPMPCELDANQAFNAQLIVRVVWRGSAAAAPSFLRSFKWPNRRIHVGQISYQIENARLIRHGPLRVNVSQTRGIVQTSNFETETFHFAN